MKTQQQRTSLGKGKIMPRSFTARLLLQEEKHHADIVCSMAPFEGQPVVYRPRHSRDNQPWILASQDGTKNPFRYAGNECHAKPGESGVTYCACCGVHIMVPNIRRESYCDDCPDGEACEVDHGEYECPNDSWKHEEDCTRDNPCTECWHSR